MKTVLLSKFRIVSIVSAMILFVVSVCSFSSMHANSANTARAYKIYKASTGEEIGGYSLTVAYGEQPTPRAVIGTDERYVDWSKSGVVKICGYEENSNKEKFLGTGFVVGEHEIATAAHVLSRYDTGRYFPDRISCIKLFNSDGTVARNIYPSRTNMTYHVPAEFYNDIWSYTRDYAVITVSINLSEYQCFDLGYVNNSLIETSSANVFITGFPGKIVTGLPNEEEGGTTVNTYTLHNMYTGEGTLLSRENIENPTSDEMLYYDVDTTGGNSGSPVYITETVKDRTFYTVIGILNTGDLSYWGPKYNCGVRFNSDVLKFYNGNPNL